MEFELSKNPGYKTLAEISPGQRAIVIELLVRGMIRHRLLDLGLLPGTEVEAVMKSPLGTPTAYRIRGSLLALRPEDASKVRVQHMHS
jgi:ferrous iron transport protein A